MKGVKFEEKREDFIEGIDNEFQELASQLTNMDFSKESNKDSILNTTLKNINNEGANNMKKINKIKKTGIVAASLLIASTIVTQTTFAQEVVGKIIKSISLGHITIVQDDSEKPEELVVPDLLKGKLFDKNGNVIEKITKDIAEGGYYTQDGEKVGKYNFEDGTVLTEKQVQKEYEESILIITDSSKLNEYTCFNVKLPSYLPEGYTFKNAEFTKDEFGDVKDSKYAIINFENKETGKKIYLQERFSCDETRSTGGADDIEKININGVDAILSNGRTIDWEDDKTIYFLTGKTLSKDEAIKIAESIK